MSSPPDTAAADQPVLDPSRTEEEKASAVHTDAPLKWIGGWRLAIIALGQILSLFMVQTESSITSTAITAITDALGGFEKSPWVFSSYLLTYSAFPIIISRLSDTLGRKTTLITCLLFFVVFSGACGAAQTIIQLIMFRWIKGISAGGITTICIGYGFELRPPEKWPNHSALLMLAAAISLAMAPLIGAAITQAGEWRWCFLLNVPIGVVAISALLLGMPHKLPLEPSWQYSGPGHRTRQLRSLRRVDVLGAVLLVGASALLLAGIQQASEGVSFGSPKVVVLLVLAPVFLIGFITWQWLISKSSWDLDPIIPWNLITNRVFVATICNAWLSGMVMTVTIVQIPQRFMLVNKRSAIDAGVGLLPFATVMAFTSVVLSVVMSKTKVAIIPTLVFGALLQIGGTAGLSQTSVDPGIEASQYGFQILAGVGVGLFNVILLLMSPLIADKKLISVSNGAINQFRILGGSVGLAIVTSATASSLKADLLQLLSREEVAIILDRTDQILTLPPDKQAMVRRSFANMYNTQMTILIGIAAAQVLVTLLKWQREPLVLKK